MRTLSVTYPTWLVVAVAFFAGLYLGFAHGRHGVLTMSEQWYSQARAQGEPVSERANPNSPNKIMRRCAGEASELGRLW